MEFKFKAWDIENEHIVNWDEIQDGWESEGYYGSIFRQDHYICLPSTNTYDVRGVEIYAGYILSSEDGRVKFEVIYDNHKNTADGDFIGFGLRSLNSGEIRIYDKSYETMLVIGTIFTYSD